MRNLLKELIIKALIKRRPFEEPLWIAKKIPKKTLVLEKYPSKRIVQIIYMATIVLLGLIVLEALYIVVTKTFSNEIFSAITSLIGLVFGTILGVKA